MADEKKLPKPESLEAKFLLLAALPYDPRAKRKHSLVFGFILDWFHSTYGNALASVRHVVATLKERDPSGRGLYSGDVHSALSDLVAWGYLHQVKGSGRQASRYIPAWDLVCVRKTPNATDDVPSVRENANADVRENANANGLSVHENPNEDPLTGPGHRTGSHVVGSTFEAAPPAPPADGLKATAAETASGDGFSEFWKVWPRKHGIKKARAEWRKILCDVDIVIEVAGDWAAHYEKHGTEKKWIPEPANWLAGERWLEDLPIVHVDAKGAAIAKAKANAPANAAAKAEPVADNDNERGAPVLDVGPFSPIGTFDVTIVGGHVQADINGEKVTLLLKLSDGHGSMHDIEHVLYGQHSDSKIQARGQAFLRTLADCLGIDSLTDTEQLNGHRVNCTVDQRFAISYRKAA
ncbi:MAG: hypothetical protein KUL88_04775 [Rhizobium sp.]|nr:hypothetical protein [Rhizobium sp.]